MGNIVESVFAFTTDKFNRSLLTRPYTSKSKIIFPYDKRKKDYTLKEFQKYSPHPKLSIEKLNEMLDMLASTKNHDANMDCTTCLAFTLVIFVLLIITILPLFLILMNGKGFRDVGTWFLTLFGCFLLIALIAAICYRFDSLSEEKRMEKREKEVKRVLQAYNNKEFFAKNSRWSCGYGGSYLAFEDLGPAVEVVETVKRAPQVTQHKRAPKKRLRFVGMKRNLVKVIRRL